MNTSFRLALAGWLAAAFLGGVSETRIVYVAGDVAWTDTGIEVVQGQTLAFEAEGRLSLQKGNPEAECGPDGYDLRTVQQPLTERKLGALIGKVVVSVTVIEDEKTGEKKTEEVAELFYVGARNRVEMPATGRLFLGINELVVGDNFGEFAVLIETAPGADVPYF